LKGSNPHDGIGVDLKIRHFIRGHRGGFFHRRRHGAVDAGSRERPLYPVADRRWCDQARYENRRRVDLYRAGAGWACYAVPDERAALDAEIGRLQADNEKLKAQLDQREPTVAGKIDEPLPKTDSLKPPESKPADSGRKIEIPLPSDRDMDRMMSFLQQAWQRLVDLANRMQKDVGGKI
jgi:hypothetical protein